MSETLRDKINKLLDFFTEPNQGEKYLKDLEDDLVKLCERESNKAVIEELERQNKHYLSKGGHLLLYDDENGNPVYLSERLEALKEQIGEE